MPIDLEDLDNNQKIELISSEADNESLMLNLVDEPLPVVQEIAAKVKFLSVMEKILNHKSEHARSSLARNPNLPFEIQEVLAEDLFDWTRENLARNKNTDQKVLHILTDDDIEDVREAVASNANTSIKDIYWLTKDLVNDVARKADSNPRYQNLKKMNACQLLKLDKESIDFLMSTDMLNSKQKFDLLKSNPKLSKNLSFEVMKSFMNKQTDASLLL
jgi:hypothetical protein